MSGAKSPTEGDPATEAGGWKKALGAAGGKAFDEAPYKAAWDGGGSDAATAQAKLNLA